MSPPCKQKACQRLLRYPLVLLISLPALTTPLPVGADNTDSHLVSFRLGEINELTVSGDPPVFVVDTATAGQDPEPALDSSTTYEFQITSTTGTDNIKKITASLDQRMPDHYSLRVTLGTPGGATSNGQVTLNRTAQTLVTNIDAGMQTGLSISYELTARARGGIVNGSRVVTFTLQDTGS